MIFKDMDELKEQFRWLGMQCSIPPLSARRLGSNEFEHLIQSCSGTDETSIRRFAEDFFESVALKSPLWNHEIDIESLPVLALFPGRGIRVVFARDTDGSWKCEGPEGISSEEDFPDKTYFSPLKALPERLGKRTATQMFKEIAYRQKSFVVHAAIASLSINILALGTSFYSMQVYDRVIPTQGMSTLVALSVGVFIAIFLEMILKLARATILDHASKNIDIACSHDIFSRFLKIRSDALPKSVGTLSGQLQSYGSVRAFIASAALYLVVDFPFSMIFLAVIILLAGWSMGLIAFAFLIISIVTGTFFRKKIERLSQTSSMASHKKLGLLVETLANAENIKATGAGWSILGQWNTLTEDAIHDDIHIRHYSELSSYMAAFFQQVSYVILVATGAFLVATTDQLTMGGLIATTILSGRVLSPIAMLPNLLVQWGKTKIALKDLNAVYALQSDHEGIDRPLSPVLDQPVLQCNNLKFSYSKEASLLKIDDLTIRPGERIAVLGPIGSGKSTLLKLLTGLYRPQEGSVLVNGIDMQLILRSRLNETIGYLPQSVKLIAGTLRENLIFGLAGIADEKILEAAKKTGLIHLLNTLPQGLDTPVPEGGESVSGGQKQLIALTRMVLAEPTIWILDEPTASMDETTERSVLRLLHTEIGPDKTLIVVTHKPAIVGLVQRVIVVTQQGVAMDGPRNAVLEQLKPATQAASV